MAETNPVIDVSNHFSLGAKFALKSASEENVQQYRAIFGGTGNRSCSRTWSKGKQYAQAADYCGGASPDIAGDLDNILSAFGDVAGSALVTKCSIKFTAGDAAEVSVEGHQHDANPHGAGTIRTADVSDIIPASSGVGVPELIAVAGTVDAVEATITFEAEHVDKDAATGDHGQSQNIRVKATLEVSYSGTVTSATAGDWENIIIATSEENSDLPTSRVTCEQYVDVTAPAGD